MKNNPKRSLIIKAAQRRFVRHGLKKTSIEEIARDLRIGKATIYHYFPSKEEIFNEVLRNEIEKFSDEISGIFNEHDIEFKTKLEKFIELKRNFSEKFILLNEILINSFQNDPLQNNFDEYYPELLKVFFNKENEIFISFLKNQLNKKQLNSKVAEYFIFQTWNFYFSKKIKSGFHSDDEIKKFRNFLIDFFIVQIT